MTPDEVEGRFLLQPGNFWMGRNAFDSENPVGFGDDRHVMLVSGSRGGKGVSVIVPNLCLWPGSMVVIDPKGENATLTAARRGHGSEHCDGMGQAVHVLDPMNVARVDERYRARFNPLDALDASSPHVIDDATRIADAIVEIGQGESRQWDEGARALVRTLILHVLTHPEYEGRRNLITVRRLILRGEHEMAAELKARAQKRGDGSASPSGQVILWELACTNDALGGVIPASADSFLESAKNSPKQYNSYRIVAERNTEFLDSPGMAESLSSSSFSLPELKTNPTGMSVYLSLPQRFMSTHYRWLRMMIALTITEMESVAGQPASGVPVLMALDEFAGLRRMEIIENAVAQTAGFGVKLFFVLQSLEQLKSVYPDRWETFLANCGVRIFFATTDNFTNQYVSDSLGEQEIVRLVRNTSTNASDTTSISQSTTESMSEQTSTADTFGTTTTTGSGGNRSTSRGTNKSTSRGRGISENSGVTYDPVWFFADRTGRSTGSGTSSNSGSAQGTSWTDGMGRNWSKSKSRQKSRTITKGTTRGTSTTSQSGTSITKGTSEGLSEQIHKKPLVTKDEMAKLFTRIDDPSHRAYPGLALVSIAGEAPFLLRRTPYYSDPHFRRMYDPHPDHPHLPAPDPKPVLAKEPKWPRNHGTTIQSGRTFVGEELNPDTELLSTLKRQRSMAQVFEKKRYERINAPFDIARDFLLDLDAHQHWFRHPDPRIGSKSIPKKLYPGARIPSGIIWSVARAGGSNQQDRLDFTTCFLSENYNVPIFFRFHLYKIDSHSCELLIMKEWYEKWAPLQILSVFGIGNRGIFPRNHKHYLDAADGDLIPPVMDKNSQLSVEELDEDVRKVSLSFKYACEDIADLGFPDFDKSENTEWIVAPIHGNLKFRADPGLGLPLEPGDAYDATQEAHQQLHFADVEGSTLFGLGVSGKGTILDIVKYDGKVEQGERIIKVLYD